MWFDDTKERFHLFGCQKGVNSIHFSPCERPFSSRPNHDHYCQHARGGSASQRHAFDFIDLWSQANWKGFQRTDIYNWLSSSPQLHPLKSSTLPCMLDQTEAHSARCIPKFALVYSSTERRRGAGPLNLLTQVNMSFCRRIVFKIRRVINPKFRKWNRVRHSVWPYPWINITSTTTKKGTHSPENRKNCPSVTKTHKYPYLRY